MVKNKTGGNKGKKFGRKHLGGNSFNAKLRISQEEDEVYACVTKLLGNGMCHVNCLDSKSSTKNRLCIIRNKFRGRGKRDNNLVMGTYVLVGVRSWETIKEGSIEKCDLIEVYNQSEVTRLKSQEEKNWKLIHIADLTESKEDDMSDVGFSFENKANNSELEKQLENITTSNNDEENNFLGNDINIEDI
jgi:initiation factor 1A